MSKADRLIRIGLVAIMLTLYLTGTVSGVLGIALLVLSGIFLLTSLGAFCPIYSILGISTCRVRKA